MAGQIKKENLILNLEMRGRERAREIIWRNRGEELSTYTGRREGGREREEERE